MMRKRNLGDLKEKSCGHQHKAIVESKTQYKVLESCIV